MKGATLGGHVKRARKRRQLTRVEVAKASGLSQFYLWSLENGHIDNPTMATLRALSRALPGVRFTIAGGRLDVQHGQGR